MLVIDLEMRRIERIKHEAARLESQYETIRWIERHRDQDRVPGKEQRAVRTAQQRLVAHFEVQKLITISIEHPQPAAFSSLGPEARLPHRNRARVLQPEECQL